MRSHIICLIYRATTNLHHTREVCNVGGRVVVNAIESAAEKGIGKIEPGQFRYFKKKDMRLAARILILKPVYKTFKSLRL